MKTRRSRKSFDPPPSPKKRRRSNKNKGRPLKAVNETIVVLSDSDNETDVIPTVTISNPYATVDDDDIQVIDIADVTHEEGEIIETKRESPRASVPVPSKGPTSTTTTSSTLPNVVRVARTRFDYLSPCRKRTSPVQSKSPPSGNNVSISNAETPVINIDEETETCSVQNDDNDELQFLGYVVTGAKTPTKKRPSLGTPIGSRKSNGNLQVMQGCIKKAKNTVRRTSANATRNGSTNPYNSWVMNAVAPNSRRIQKKKRNRNRNFGQFQNPNGNRPAQRYFQWNSLNRNRDRENARQVVFRPGAGPDHIPNPNQTGFSYNAVPPPNPPNMNTENVNMPGGRNNERAQWMPVNRPRLPNGPPAIPEGSNIGMANDTGSASNRPLGSLRPIVIDGSNVAIGHGDVLKCSGQRFSPRGIQICVDYFRKRGHTEVIAFVPRFRTKLNESRDAKLLEALEKDGCVRFTPSREAGPHRIASYDDLFVIQYAHQTGGIIISNDNFKDIYGTNPHLQETITLRQMMFTWVTPDVIMFPQDPLGAGGPTLDDFLKF